MSIFARPHYDSEATQFLNSLKQERSYLDAQQRQGRSLLWDKQIDREVQRDIQAGRVAQKPYPYQTEPSQH